jgi:hypothetical protein
MREKEKHATRRVMNMNVEGWRGRRRPKKDMSDYDMNI